MQRRPSIPSSSPTDGPAVKAAELRERAMRLIDSPERDRLLREVDRLDQSARMSAYLASKELEPPT